MSERQNKKSTRFWLLVAAVIISPFLLVVLFRMFNHSEFERRVAALKDQGYPVSFDDLEERYVLPEGAENAADVYIEAFSYYQPATGDEEKFLPVSGNYSWPDDTPPFPQEVMDALETYLQRNQKTIELLGQAAAMEHCIWPRTYDIHSLHYYLSDIRGAGQLLCEQNLYLAQKGDVDNLYDLLQVTIGLSNALSEQPNLIDHLVTTAMKGSAASNLEDVLSQVDFSEPQLQALQQHYQAMQDISGLHDAMIIDRCETIEYCRLFHEINGAPMPAKILYSASGLKDQGALVSLDYIEKSIAALKLPSHQRDAAVKEAEDETDSGFLANIHFQMGTFSTGIISKINRIDLRVLGNLKCAETALAIERYRMKHQSLPASLEALVPAFMDEVACDPFDNEVLRYIQHDDGFTVYSIGEDGIDDGGVSREELQKETGQRPEQYDCPFKVRRNK